MLSPLLAVTLAALPSRLLLAAVLDECSAPSNGAGVGPSLASGSGSGLRTVGAAVEDDEDEEGALEEAEAEESLAWRCMASCSLSAIAFSRSSLRWCCVTSGSLPSFRPMSYGSMASAGEAGATMEDYRANCSCEQSGRLIR